MIPNKEITRSQFYELIDYQKLYAGGEATICESDTPFSVYKLFYHCSTPVAMPPNKVKKISRLYDEQVEHSVHPLCTISLDDVIVGYEMTSDIDLKKAQICFLDIEEKKYFLTKTKEILEYFSSLGIIYGDVEPRNILYDRNTGRIEFCDMDNIAWDDLPMDLIPNNVVDYNTSRPIDKNLHPYMHNLMTLKSLGIDTYWATRRELRSHFKRPAIKIIKSMKDPANFNNEYIVQYLKK